MVICNELTESATILSMTNTPDWIWMIAFIAAWLLLTQWLLPKLGVPT
jgi:hypothetical protein